MHLHGSYSGRDLSIASDGSLTFTKSFVFIPDISGETQLDLYMCSGFPHIGDEWKFDNPSAHPEIVVNFAKNLVCTSVSNVTKEVDVEIDQASDWMIPWRVDATYKIKDGVNIGGGSIEPMPVSPDPFPSGSTTPSAVYMPENFNVVGAPWEKYAEYNVEYSQVDVNLKTAPATVSLPKSDLGEWGTYVTWAGFDSRARWLEGYQSVANSVGEEFDFTSTIDIATETITWSSKELIKYPNYTFANKFKVTTALGHGCRPHSIKVSPVSISKKFYNWTLNSQRINELIQAYTEEHPTATLEEIQALYSQYYNNPNLVIPYYEYQLKLDFNPAGWIQWYEDRGNQAFFNYNGEWELEPIYNVVAASGFSVASSIVISGLCGLREWNDIDARFNKAYIDKALAQSGYVMNATASQITNCIIREDIVTDHHEATLDKDELFLKGFSSFDPEDLSSTISDNILFTGNWPERLLLF